MTKPHSGKTHQHNQDPENPHDKVIAAWTRRAGVASWVMVGVTAIYMITSILQYTAMLDQTKLATKSADEAEKSAAAAKTSNDNAREFFISTQRPWLAFGRNESERGAFDHSDLYVDGISMLKDGSVQLQFGIYPKNVGPAPAKQAHFRYKADVFILGTTPPAEITNFQTAACAPPDKDEVAGMIILPGQSVRVPFNPITLHTKVSVANIKNAMIVVALCANYGSTNEVGHTHQTLSTYLVQGKTKPLFADLIDRHVRRDNVFVVSPLDIDCCTAR